MLDASACDRAPLGARHGIALGHPREDALKHDPPPLLPRKSGRSSIDDWAEGTEDLRKTG
jgi:hypothetical protein